jgi:hypothetical protein
VVAEDDLLRKFDAALERSTAAIERSTAAIERSDKSYELMSRAFRQSVQSQNRFERLVLEALADMRDQLRASTDALLRLIDRLDPEPGHG